MLHLTFLMTNVILDESSLVSLMENYLAQFGDKAACFEDLMSYLDMESGPFERWTAFLSNHQPSFVSSISNLYHSGFYSHLPLRHL
jgi:hypothetical protein